MEIIGFIAAILATTAVLPQAYKTWETKDVSGLSLPMLSLFFVGIVGWLVYGVLKQIPSMVFANSVTIISSFLPLIFQNKAHTKINLQT